jgi:hypothetical protein
VTGVDRRRYQAEVARLLEVIDAQSRRRLRLKAAGLQQHALAALEGDTARARERLSALIRDRAAAMSSRAERRPTSVTASRMEGAAA